MQKHSNGHENRSFPNAASNRSQIVEKLRVEILEALHSVYGKERKANFSKSVSIEGLSFFYKILSTFREKNTSKPLVYLEIGSFEGVSMVVVSMLAQSLGIEFELHSVDPYFDEGYTEDHPLAGSYTKQSNPRTQEKAFELYKKFDLKVNLLRKESIDALSELIKEGKRFNFAYIDGYHNGLMPICDLGMTFSLLSKDSILVLDDHNWPEIRPLRALLDNSLECIAEIEDIIAYNFSGKHSLYASPAE